MQILPHLRATQLAVKVLPPSHEKQYLYQQKLADYKKGFLTSNISDIVKPAELLEAPHTPRRVAFRDCEIKTYFLPRNELQEKLRYWNMVKSHLYQDRDEANFMLSTFLAVSPRELTACKNAFQ